MTIPGAIIAILPLLYQLYSLLQTSRKDKNNLIEKLSNELHREVPKAYVVESLIAKLHKMRAPKYDELKIILNRNNGFEIMNTYATGRRMVSIIELNTTLVPVRFEYSELYKKREYRRGIRISFLVVGLIAYYFGYKYQTEVLDQLVYSSTEERIMVMGSEIAFGLNMINAILGFLIYMPFTVHAARVWFCRFTIKRLNVLLNAEAMHVTSDIQMKPER
ncbi:hypothetical protein [Pantoea rwandensis]|uniref:Uncharacterized protein n=1 Tax=Pantoea rwandensis TaxID=1076550 RepID=A0A1X1D3G9_9GAMM|nr:hypothetical protein [Pantoea rwandensis]ORM71130.1 hypothetical protein HA51_04405 [Pantoea rwandensis]